MITMNFVQLVIVICIVFFIGLITAFMGMPKDKE